MHAMVFDQTDIEWLKHILTTRIPLGQAMHLNITTLDDKGIGLSAPLEPNVNDKGTAFGGALVSMMTLAGWSLPRLLLRSHKLKAELVIGHCEVRFLQPVDEAFEARCAWPEPKDINRFIEQFRSRGKARIELAPEIRAGDQLAATLSARYAAV